MMGAQYQNVLLIFGGVRYSEVYVKGGFSVIAFSF